MEISARRIYSSSSPHLNSGLYYRRGYFDLQQAQIGEEEELPKWDVELCRSVFGSYDSIKAVKLAYARKPSLVGDNPKDPLVGLIEVCFYGALSSDEDLNLKELLKNLMKKDCYQNLYRCWLIHFYIVPEEVLKKVRPKREPYEWSALDRPIYVMFFREAMNVRIQLSTRQALKLVTPVLPEKPPNVEEFLKVLNDMKD